MLTRNEQIIEGAQAGSSRADLARQFGLSESRVGQILRQSGFLVDGRWVANMRRDGKYGPYHGGTEGRNQEIIDSYRTGQYSQAELARIYSLTRQRVEQILRQAGFKARTEQVGRDTKQAVAELLKANGTLSLREVADRYGLSRGTLNRALEAEGFDQAEAVARVRAERKMALAQARLAGVGEVECSSCGEVKSWGEMRVTTRRGVKTRVALCHDCNSVRTSEARERRPKTHKPTVTRKRCTNCGEVKGSTQFWRNADSSDGLQSWCKDCYKDWRTE